MFFSHSPSINTFPRMEVINLDERCICTSCSLCASEYCSPTGIPELGRSNLQRSQSNQDIVSGFVLLSGYGEKTKHNPGGQFVSVIIFSINNGESSSVGITIRSWRPFRNARVVVESLVARCCTHHVGQLYQWLIRGHLSEELADFRPRRKKSIFIQHGIVRCICFHIRIQSVAEFRRGTYRKEWFLGWLDGNYVDTYYYKFYWWDHCGSCDQVRRIGAQRICAYIWYLTQWYRPGCH